MNNFINKFMVGVWIFQLIYGIVHMVNGTNIHPFLFICAAGICILYYVQEIQRCNN